MSTGPDQGRPNSRARGYGSSWRIRRLFHLSRVAREQEAQGWPAGPWCQCEDCEVRRAELQEDPAIARAPVGYRPATLRALGMKADTVDHRRPRRLFPLELQGSEAPGGSDHPDNLRALSHAHHSRRREDKARRRS